MRALRGGDAVAGSQVTGLVSEQRGHLTVQNQQSSDDPVAISGDAAAVNALLVEAGPQATTDDATSTATQIGDNDVTAAQTAEAWSGDAVAGGQVTGVVGAGTAAITLSNTSEGAEATSGDAEAATAVLFALAWLVLGGDPREFVVAVVFLAALPAITVIDLRHQIIPDAITIPGVLVGLASSFATQRISWVDSIAAGESFTRALILLPRLRVICRLTSALTGRPIVPSRMHWRT